MVLFHEFNFAPLAKFSLAKVVNVLKGNLRTFLALVL